MITSLHLFGIVFIFPDPIINMLANESVQGRERHTKNSPTSYYRSALQDDNTSPPYTRRPSAPITTTTSGWITGEYLILLPPKPFQITPRTLIHSIRIPQISSSLIIQSRRNGILLNTPPISETIRKLVDCEYEFTLCGAASFQAGFEGLGFDGG